MMTPQKAKSEQSFRSPYRQNLLSPFRKAGLELGSQTTPFKKAKDKIEANILDEQLKSKVLDFFDKYFEAEIRTQHIELIEKELLKENQEYFDLFNSWLKGYDQDESNQEKLESLSNQISEATDSTTYNTLKIIAGILQENEIEFANENAMDTLFMVILKLFRRENESEIKTIKEKLREESQCLMLFERWHQLITNNEDEFWNYYGTYLVECPDTVEFKKSALVHIAYVVHEHVRFKDQKEDVEIGKKIQEAEKIFKEQHARECLNEYENLYSILEKKIRGEHQDELIAKMGKSLAEVEIKRCVKNSLIVKEIGKFEKTSTLSIPLLLEAGDKARTEQEKESMALRIEAQTESISKAEARGAAAVKAEFQAREDALVARSAEEIQSLKRQHTIEYYKLQLELEKMRADKMKLQQMVSDKNANILDLQTELRALGIQNNGCEKPDALGAVKSHVVQYTADTQSTRGLDLTAEELLKLNNGGEIKRK